MRSFSTISVVVTFLFLPSMGYAFEADYYSYNGFQETVDAFKRISFIFNDTDYQSVLYTTAVLGILIAGIVVFGKGLSGQGGHPLTWFVPIIFGVIVYQGLIIPKDKIHIYDRVLNAYEAVSGVPDGIIIMATMLNKVERIFIDIVDKNTVNPWADFEKEAGGISFKLIEKATANYIDVEDVYLTKSIKQYYNDCGIISLGIPGSTVTINELRRGTTNMKATLEKMNSPALSTTYYTTAKKWGELLTCQDAWTNINTLLSTVTTWDEPINAVCSKAGFSVGSATQLTQCKTQLAKAQEVYGLVGGSAINFIRNSYLSNAILEETMSGSIDSAQTMLANRNLMVQSVGSSAMINEWMPKVRAWVLTVILGLTPMIAIFLLTPLFLKAAALIGGMLIWFTTWGIIDVILHAGAVDASFRAYEQISGFQMGLDAMWLSPEASMQALSVFGQSRIVALALSGVIVAGLFKLSIGSSLASIGSSAINTAGGEGKSAAIGVGTTEGQGTLARRSVDGQAARAVYANHGMEGMSRGTAFEESTRISSSNTQVNDGMSHGFNLQETSAAVGAMSTMPTDKLNAASNILNMNGKEATPENLHEFQSSLNEISATRGLTDPSSYRNALSRSFGKDVLTNDERFVEAATYQQTFSHLDSVMSASSTGKAASMIAEKIYDQTGIYPTQPEVTKNLQSIIHGDLPGRINAVNGDGDKWEQHQTNSNIKSTAMLGAEVEGFKDNNITPREVYEQTGRKSAAEGIGIAKILNEYGMQPFVLASQKESAQKGSEGNEWYDNIVQKGFNGDVKAAEDFLAIPNVAESYGKATRLQQVADTFFEGDPYAAHKAMGSTDEQFTVSAEKFREFAQNNPGDFSKEQIDTINNSDHVDIRFSHDGKGNFSNIHGYTGTEVGYNKSSSYDSSDSISAGTRLYENTMREMFSGNSQESVDLLQNAVLNNRYDPEQREAFMAEWTQTMEHMATSTSTDSTTLRAGVDGSVGLGRIGKAMEAVGVDAGINGSANKEWSDYTQFNTVRSALEGSYTSMENEAMSYAKEVSSNKTEQEDIFSSVMANRIREYNDGLMSELKNQAADDSDLNKIMSLSESAEESRVGKILR